MATVYVTEFASIGRGSDGARMPVGDNPAVANDMLDRDQQQPDSNRYHTSPRSEQQ